MQATIALGRSLRQLRQERGWSLDALARRVGVNKSTLSRWEAGKVTPRRHELGAAIAALNVAPERAQALWEAAGQLPPALSDTPCPPVSGDLLRALRLRRGLSQSQAARAANLSQGTLSKWERSEDWPPTDRLHTLCFALQASSEEVAMLTRGRFLPSYLPQAKTDQAALDILEARKQELVTGLQHGSSDGVEFGLLQLEADAWRLTLHNPRAGDVLLDAMRWQVMFYGGYHYDEARFAHLMRRSARYARSLNRENHHLLVTQRIVSLEKQAGHCRVQSDNAGLGAVARSYLALLSRTHGALAPEYRSWIYMEAARTLSAIAEPDTLSVQRLIDASFAQPRGDGMSRSEEPMTVRYAACTYARMGRVEEAVAMIDRVMIGGYDSFDGYLLLARIAWATDRRDAAEGHFASAASIARANPEYHNLLPVVDNVRTDLFTNHDRTPRGALR